MKSSVFLLLVGFTLCLLLSSAWSPRKAGAQGTDTLDDVLQGMVDELYERAETSGAKGVRTGSMQVSGIAWESADGVRAGSSDLGALLSENLNSILSNSGNLIGPDEPLRSKGLFGSILKGAFKIVKGGVELTLNLVDAQTGGILSSVTQIIDSAFFPDGGGLSLLPPDPEGTTDLGHLVENALAGFDSDFDVRVSTDRGEYGAYTEGENISLYVEVEKDCYVRIYHLSWQDKKMSMIFPNTLEENSFVEGGTVRKIPAGSDEFLFQVAAPYGVDAIIAIASTSPFVESDKEAGETGEGEDTPEISDDNVKGILSKGLVLADQEGQQIELEDTEFASEDATSESAGDQETSRAFCFFTTLNP